MKNKFKKIISILFISVLLCEIYPITTFAKSNTDVTKENDLYEYGYLLSECVVTCEEIKDFNNECTLEFVIGNTGLYTVYDWSIVYEADFDIISANNIEVVMDDDVKQLKCTEYDNRIDGGSAKKFTLVISEGSNYEIPKYFRVYGAYLKETLNDEIRKDLTISFDGISYDTATGKMVLMPYDKPYYSEHRLFEPDSDNSSSYNPIEDSIIPDSENNFLYDATGYAIIGDTDSRTKVSNVTTNPYNHIALLLVRYSDDAVAYGTGFMVSEKHMLTAAHVICSSEHGVAKRIVAYFGLNGVTYLHQYMVSSWYLNSSYIGTRSVNDDWGVIHFENAAGNNTGWFSIGYTSDSELNKMSVTITGYPGDKCTSNSNGIGNRAWYMYKDTSSTRDVYSKYFTYTADTNHGQSGSPVYKSNYVAYGIHSGYNNKDNQCKRIDKDLFEFLLSNGWINK